MSSLCQPRPQAHVGQHSIYARVIARCLRHTSSLLRPKWSLPVSGGVNFPLPPVAPTRMGLAALVGVTQPAVVWYAESGQLLCSEIEGHSHERRSSKVRTLLIPRSDLGGKSSGAQRYLSYLILAFTIAITLSACVPPTPTPRPTPRPSPTSTPSCEALRSEYCKELHALMERYTWEILPLCDTKPHRRGVGSLFTAPLAARFQQGVAGGDAGIGKGTRYTGPGATAPTSWPGGRSGIFTNDFGK